MQEPQPKSVPARSWEQRLATRLGQSAEIGDIAPREPEPCLNCQAEVRFAFCPKCGQRRGDYRRSLGGFLRELFAETLEIDGRVGRTFRLLVFRPGALTREYGQGRRQRYISPLRLYLFMSLLALGAISIAAKVEAMRTPPATEITARQGIVVKGDTESGWLADRMQARADAINALSPQAAGAEIIASILDLLPLALFVLLPVFAGLMTLTMLGSKRYYLEHLVFAVHVHCFWFLLIAFAVPLSFVSDWFGLLLLLAPGHFVFALQHAYDASWGATAVRAIVLGVTYGLALLITFPLLFFASLIVGG